MIKFKKGDRVEYIGHFVPSDSRIFSLGNIYTVEWVGEYLVEFKETYGNVLITQVRLYNNPSEQILQNIIDE